jgi:hypothetical protein
MSAVEAAAANGSVIEQYMCVAAVDLFTARTVFWLMEPIRSIWVYACVRPRVGR